MDAKALVICYQARRDTQGKNDLKEPYKLFGPAGNSDTLSCLTGMNANALVVCHQEKREPERLSESRYRARAGTRKGFEQLLLPRTEEKKQRHWQSGRKIKKTFQSKLAPTACSMLPREITLTGA